jgi:acyl-CoA thioesterase-2
VGVPEVATVRGVEGRPDGPSWIAELVDLRRGEGDTFLAPEPAQANRSGRLFGGLVAAQSLAAAAATIDGGGKVPHSLHAYFVRSGRPDVDVELVVERTRVGRSFDTRRVTASQDGVVILEMLASFHVGEPGEDAHPSSPDLPALEDCVPVARSGGASSRFERRAPAQDAGFGGPPYWVRMPEPVEDDPMVRACALVYLSDMGLMAATRPRGLRHSRLTVAASLDHTVWFHRPFAPDRWHCYVAERRNNVGGRGLATGGLYDQAGALIATLAQEALWRVEETPG